MAWALAVVPAAVAVALAARGGLSPSGTGHGADACAALRPVDSLATSQAGFVAEVLDPAPTARTPRFRSSGTSYAVGKPDLAAALVAASRACERRLLGGVIVGPTGGLWAYRVLVLLGDTAAGARANLVVFPHARITGKATGTLTRGAADTLLAGLMTSPLLSPGAAPTPRRRRDLDGLGREFAYDVLAFRVDGPTVHYRHGAVLRRGADSAAVARLFAGVNALLPQLRKTYPADSTAPAR